MQELINFLAGVGLRYKEQELTNLQTLYLSRNQLTTLPESIEKILPNCSIYF